MAESFPEDLVVEILLRLPVKSLMRFKCVSKRWRSLISDRGFAKYHLQRLKAGDLIASQRVIMGSPLVTIDYQALDCGIAGLEFHEPRMDYSSWKNSDVVGSCDGLVCLVVPGRFLIYNPTTKESRDLPDHHLGQSDHIFRGFGYDSQSDDYKIVGGNFVNWQLAIFSLKSGSWRRIQVQQQSYLVVFRQGIYWKGALRWLVVDQSRKFVIMSFNLSEERFHQVLEAPGNITFLGLGIRESSLCLYNDREVWITNTNEYGGLWTKLFSILTDHIPGLIFDEIPITFTRSGKIIFRSQVNQIILLNPEDNTCECYPIQTDGRMDSSGIYLETFVSPYLGGEPSLQM